MEHSFLVTKIFFVIWFVVLGIVVFFRVRKTKKIVGDGYERLISAIQESGGNIDTVLEDIQNFKPSSKKEQRPPLTDEEKIALMEEEIQRLRDKKWRPDNSQETEKGKP